MALITDYFGQGSAANVSPVPSTLASQKVNGASSMSLSAATGWPTATVVYVLLYQINAAGALVAGSVTSWKGILSGTTVGSLTLRGGTDTTYPGGSIVQVSPTAGWADDLITGILQQHTQTGAHINLTNTGGMTNAGGLTNTGGMTTDTLAASGAVSDYGYTLQQYRKDTWSNFVVSGCVWTPDAPGSSLNASMTSGVVWINGKRLTVAAITSHAFTASKDTYFDIQDNGDGTANLVAYTAVANNATSPALGNSGTTANTIRLAIITSGGSSISSTGVNQGQIGATGPAVSSVVLLVADSIGNLIYPIDPAAKLLGLQLFGQITINTGSFQAVSQPQNVITPSKRIKVILEVSLATNFSSSNASDMFFELLVDGVATGVQWASPVVPVNSNGAGFIFEWLIQPTAGEHSIQIKAESFGAPTTLNDTGENAAALGLVKIETY